VQAKEKNDGDSQVEIVANEPYTDDSESGQYTEKVIRFGSKMPRVFDVLLPESAKMMVEKAWNAYPICHTEYSVPFMGERFGVSLDSIHVENDIGQLPNVLLYFISRSLIFLLKNSTIVLLSSLILAKTRFNRMKSTESFMIPVSFAQKKLGEVRLLTDGSLKPTQSSCVLTSWRN
jgi:hypothetical protein